MRQSPPYPASVVPLLLVLGALLWVPAAHAQAPAASFTANQVEAGGATFRAHCASCHAEDLSGGVEGPPLKGAYFTSGWGGHPVSELIDFVAGSMPMDAPGSLQADAYLDVVAYVLSQNGAVAGPVALVRGAGGLISVERPAPVH